MTACSTCPGPDLCERCAICDSCICKCEPPIIAVEHDGVWNCEGCRRPILNGERVYLYADEDETVVAHLECPARASA